MAVALLAGCSGSAHRGGEASQRPAPTGAPTRPAPAGTGLRDGHACPEAKEFTCATLTVPLDRAAPGGAALALRVAVESVPAAPRGVLLVLTGGPGQGGVSFVPRLVGRLGKAVMAGYRLVMLDQRGTGSTALQCPQLQQAMGFSDLTPPPAAAVTACARTLGEKRRLYSTEDVVADLERLRRALRTDRLTLLGVSYGTFVAEHYALAHPDRTAALVLDSVVPHGGIDPLAVDVMRASRRVLRAACRAAGCPGDPVADLATVVRRDGDGVALLDVLTTTSIVDPTYGEILPALHAAARGDRARLDTLVAAYRRGSQGPADQLSQGLHASALCSDLRFPWGDSSVPLAGREQRLQAAAGRLAAAQLAPFDRATATGNGLVRQCLPWPPVEPAGLPTGGNLPAVPVLLVAGDRDLSTPLEWARAEAERAPRGRLVVVEGAGHSVLSRAGKGGEALREFLLG
jgi:pimeloyl-ACP methyl ester carboxylesterase